MSIYQRLSVLSTLLASKKWFNNNKMYLFIYAYNNHVLTTKLFVGALTLHDPKNKTIYVWIFV